MILAAGRGKRMRELTNHTPKALVKINDRYLIEYQLQALANAGFKEIVINVAYCMDQIIDALGDGERYGVRIQYSKEHEPNGLESGGGIFRALPLLGNSPFLVTACDLITDYPYERLRKDLSNDDLAYLVLVPNPDHHPEGDYDCIENRIRMTPKRLTYGGIGVLSPALFDNASDGFFPIRDLLNPAIDANRVSGERFDGAWHNVGSPEDIEKLLC